MRYCPYCKRLNVGKPQRCRYCGRTWFVKICPKGHINPPEALFCGECGSADLTQPAGRKSILYYLFSLLKWVVIVGVIFLIVRGLYSGIMHSINRDSPMFQSFLIALLFFLFVLYIGFSIMPRFIKTWIRKAIRRLYKSKKETKKSRA